ncbi:MAG: hypothetical protein ABI384_06315 [Allobranchiibius sp.]
MDQDEGRPSHGVEFLDADPTSRNADDVLAVPTHRWPRWLPFLLAAVLIAAAAGLIVHADSKPSASPPTRPATTQPAVSAPGTSPTASSPPASAPPITATQLGAPLLGVSAGWELFGRGDEVVVRIELARGRITRTTVPTLGSGGPVSFTTGNGWTLVRPIDFVPGDLIPDGRPARALNGALGQGGPAFPGPDRDHIWVQAGDNAPNRMVLVGVDGRSTGPSLTIPAGSSPLSAVPDQTGYLLFPGLGGVYDVRPASASRITTGAVLAVGPTRWLTADCNDRARCRAVVTARASGAQRALDTRLGEINPQPGVISPDGTKAALVIQSPSPAIEIIDLATGAAHALSLRIDLSTVDEESMVWSPDSRWLFSTDAKGHLDAVNAHTGQITDLTAISGHALPNLSQIAIGGAPAN